MEDVHEILAQQAECVTEDGGEVLIFAGQITIHAVKFERQQSHDRLAWVQDNAGASLLLDIGAIYAVRDIVDQDSTAT